MKIADEIKKQLEAIYEAGQYHKLAKSNEKYKQKDIDQALKEILKIKVKLPEKKTPNKLYMTHRQVGRNHFVYGQGYNQALSDVTKLNEE